jgi:cytochrome c2
MLPGDAERGKEVFRTQNCIACHSVNSEGGKAAPDLGKITSRDLTPSQMAGLMWNHAPAMWTAIQQKGIARPELSEEQAADLFAYFYSARYFDRPGDAARGKALFASKRCADCHGIQQAIPGGAKAVAEWDSQRDPIALAAAMWNHGAQMKATFESKKLSYPQVTGQELNDLRVYLVNLPEARRKEPKFSLASAPTGQDLFQAKGCAACHQGKRALDQRTGRRDLSDFAASMWNHEGQMGKEPVALSYAEMRRICGYLWSLQFFDDRGNPARGKQVFAKKNCASCHNNPSSGAPSLASRAGSVQAFTMVDVLWKHGPAMLSRMQQQNLPWPRFQGTEMADLTAYLNQGQTGGAAGR